MGGWVHRGRRRVGRARGREGGLGGEEGGKGEGRYVHARRKWNVRE